MKSIKALLTTAFAFACISVFAQGAKTETIKVSGNCSSCKKHIETAANIPGVTKADWNKDSKMLTLTYDPAKTSSDAVQKKIAGAGYDTEKYRADDKAYKNLDDCCQYDRKPASKS
ncbi:heavy-metal-associated domain-containing protein [Chitinophagaceae bacterium LWZ2-11]